MDEISANKKNEKNEKKTEKQSKWRAEHENFIQTIRRNRKGNKQVKYYFQSIFMKKIGK